MFAINSKFTGLDIKIYLVCLDFVKIRGAYSRNNLAKLVFKRLKKLNVLHKLISLTGDNAKNNDTCACYLFKIIESLYNTHLNLMPIHGKEIRFLGEESLINCLAHIDNLIYKAILKSLGFSTHKGASEFLDQVKEHG
jgi:hypothetical protein